eukprot:6172736-Pleurochrysis_carterae.AAC.1
MLRKLDAQGGHALKAQEGTSTYYVRNRLLCLWPTPQYAASTSQTAPLGAEDIERFGRTLCSYTIPLTCVQLTAGQQADETTPTASILASIQILCHACSAARFHASRR